VDAPLDLPTGWPYDMVEQIVRAREIEAAGDAPDSGTNNGPDVEYVPVSTP